jgi:hypothetical protein
MRFANTVLLLCLLGCAHQSHNRALHESKAIEMAKQAVVSRESKQWAAGATYDAAWRSGAWSVMVSTTPSYPGDFRIVRVDSDGKLIEYYVGSR